VTVSGIYQSHVLRNSAEDRQSTVGYCEQFGYPTPGTSQVEPTRHYAVRDVVNRDAIHRVRLTRGQLRIPFLGANDPCRLDIHFRPVGRDGHYTAGAEHGEGVVDLNTADWFETGQLELVEVRPIEQIAPLATGSDREATPLTPQIAEGAEALSGRKRQRGETTG
jgi:hypothetical protein